MEDNDIYTHLLMIINKNTIGFVIWHNYSQELNNYLKKEMENQITIPKLGSFFKTPPAPNKHYKSIILIFS